MFGEIALIENIKRSTTCTTAGMPLNILLIILIIIFPFLFIKQTTFFAICIAFLAIYVAS